MVDANRPKPPDLQGSKAVVVVLVTVLLLIVGGYWGWTQNGPLGAMLGVMLGAALGALIYTVVRVSDHSNRIAEPSAPDVRELPPDQALQVLSALMNAAASASESGASFSLGLLGEIAAARDKASKKGDIEGAIKELKRLAEEHPRSSAVSAELSRVHRMAGDEEAAKKAASEALYLALRGGMNGLALQLFAEFDGAEELTLEGSYWEQLARILDHADKPEDAAKCRARAGGGSESE
ncbi:hypothetical protein [Plesiocystis pacifica]|uniref:hypothetical protein n=1 Tax=Plesiocystis pacifica TaxID=191768 RepID=UPI0012FCDEC0|nr:hypothetical protein [Plesiocystis pacifica]